MQKGDSSQPLVRKMMYELLDPIYTNGSKVCFQPDLSSELQPIYPTAYLDIFSGISKAFQNWRA